MHDLPVELRQIVVNNLSSLQDCTSYRRVCREFTRDVSDETIQKFLVRFKKDCYYLTTSSQFRPYLIDRATPTSPRIHVYYCQRLIGDFEVRWVGGHEVVDLYAGARLKAQLFPYDRRKLLKPASYALPKVSRA